MTIPALIAKTGLLTVAATMMAVTATAAPASAAPATAAARASLAVAELPADSLTAEIAAAEVTRAVGTPSVDKPATGATDIANLWEPITVTSTEAPEITVVRPMAEGTYRNTSQYGPRWGSIHTGTDFAARVGTPIFAIADGTVVHAGGGRDGRSGQLVIIHHVIDGQDVWSWYGHMYSDGVYVAEGETVKAGQLIAGVGNAGRSTGAHLHFEIHVDELESHVDPLTFLSQVDAPFPAAA